MNTKSSQQLSISMNSASTIATCLKEAMRNIDRELKKTKDSAVGEMTLAVLHTKRKALRAAYDELKAAGLEVDTTIQNW